MTLLGYIFLGYMRNWLCTFKITSHNGGYWGSVEWNDCPNQIWYPLHGNPQRGLAQSLYDSDCIDWFYCCLMSLFRKASLKWCCFGLWRINTFSKNTSKYTLSELVRTGQNWSERYWSRCAWATVYIGWAGLEGTLGDSPQSLGVLGLHKNWRSVPFHF